MTSNQPFPEEYTDGYVIFMGRRFITDPRALIPRLETEELVKYCLKFLREHPTVQTVADIGTGSGIIPISIAEKLERPLQVFATDMSEDALSLARENNKKNNQNCPLDKGGTKGGFDKKRAEQVNSDKHHSSAIHEIPPTPPYQGGNIHFFQGDLLQPLISHFGNSVPDEILITANLPYVREVEINSGLLHEPRMAFLGGVQTGFELYERFFEQLLAWKNRPKTCHVVIEFGLWQRDIAETVFQKHGLQYSFFSDLRGIERFACVQL